MSPSFPAPCPLCLRGEIFSSLHRFRSWHKPSGPQSLFPCTLFGKSLPISSVSVRPAAGSPRPLRQSDSPPRIYASPVLSLLGTSHAPFSHASYLTGCLTPTEPLTPYGIFTASGSGSPRHFTVPSSSRPTFFVPRHSPACVPPSSLACPASCLALLIPLLLDSRRLPCPSEPLFTNAPSRSARASTIANGPAITPSASMKPTTNTNTTPFATPPR